MCVCVCVCVCGVCVCVCVCVFVCVWLLWECGFRGQLTAARHGVPCVQVALLAALAATTHSSARRSELVEASPQMQQELMGCAKLAKEFKGAKVLARKVTQVRCPCVRACVLGVRARAHAHHSASARNVRQRVPVWA